MPVPWNKGLRKYISKVCSTCGRSYVIRADASNKSKYCSKQCQGKGVLGIPRTKEWRDRIGLALTGKKKSLISIEKMRIAKLGKKQSSETIAKRVAKNTGKRRTQEFRDSRSGEKCHLWKGGITSVNKRIRDSLEYKLWRKAVLERDNYICVWCGKKGGDRQVDHIKPFAYYPELRFAIDNGRTLCKECHRTTDTYGNKYRMHIGYKK